MKNLIKSDQWVRIYSGIVCDERWGKKLLFSGISFFLCLLYLGGNTIVVRYIFIHPFIPHPINISDTSYFPHIPHISANNLSSSSSEGRLALSAFHSSSWRILKAHSVYRCAISL